MFGATSLKNCTQSLGNIRHLAARPSDANQTPTVAILDGEQNVVWQRVGKALGDYPSIDDVIENLPD